MPVSSIRFILLNYNNRTLCIFGSQGYLVSNQLPAHTMRGVVLYCHAHKLLQMTASHQVTETVEWAELFVEKPESDDPVYRVLDTKHYILAIAMVGNT